MQHERDIKYLLGLVFFLLYISYILFLLTFICNKIIYKVKRVRHTHKTVKCNFLTFNIWSKWSKMWKFNIRKSLEQVGSFLTNCNKPNPLSNKLYKRDLLKKMYDKRWTRIVCISRAIQTIKMNYLIYIGRVLYTGITITILWAVFFSLLWTATLLAKVFAYNLFHAYGHVHKHRKVKKLKNFVQET